MKRIAGQILMLALVIAGSLLLKFHQLLPWDPWVIQGLFGVLGVLLLGCFIDGLLVFIALMRHEVKQNQEQKPVKEQNR